MKRILFLISLFFSTVVFGQVSNPLINASQIFADSATISWTKPATSDSFVLQRSLDFSAWSQVYAGGQQVFYDTTLDGNTDYYYRVKAINKANGQESGWAVKNIKTFWSPSATSQGGNRIATQADVDNATLNPDGFINVGDYLYVGYNGTGAYCPSGVCFQWGKTIFLTKPPALAPGKKICIVGNTGYDYIEIDCSNNVGTVADPIIITNIGGQSKTGQFRLNNAKHYLITGRYDPVKKTGSSKYLGFDNLDWTNLYGSFGFYFQSTWGQRAASVIGVAGDCEDVRFEYIQAGEGGFATIVVKNDSYHPSDISASSTGSLSSYADVSQTSFNLPTTPTTWTAERIRITLNTVTSINIDSIYFVGTGSTTGTYRYQAETYDGSNGVTNNGSTVTLTTASTSNKAFIDIKTPGLPKGGTFTYHIVMSNTTTASISNQVAAIPIDGLTLSNDYFADGGSEGIYSGSTQAHPTEAIKNVKIINNIYARNGGNNIQIGQNKDSAIVRNNVLINGGDEWSNSFQRFQGQSTQFGHRQNRISFENNLVLGSQEVPWNFSINPTAYDTVYTTDTAKIVNNAIIYSRDYNAGYMNSNNFGKGTIMLQNNYWGRFGNGAEKLYNTSKGNFVVLLGTDGGNGTVTMRATGNIYDTSISSGGAFIRLNQSNDPDVTLTDASNVRQNAVPVPVFNNYMDMDSNYNYSNMETWTDFYGKDWNSTNRSGTKFDSAATAQGTTLALATIPRVYNLGDIVRHNGKFYKSLIANNTGHMPTGYTDQYWQLIIFSNGSVMPIDDVRQKEGSFYQAKGMGLMYVVPTTPAAANNHFFKYKKGSKIVVKQAY